MERVQIVIDEKDMEELRQKTIRLKDLNMDLKKAKERLSLDSRRMKFGWNVQYEEKLDMLAVIIAFMDLDDKEMTFYWKETFRFYVDRRKYIYVPEYRTEDNNGVDAYPVRTSNVFTKKEFVYRDGFKVFIRCCTNMRPADVIDCGGGYFRINSWGNPVLKEFFANIEKMFSKFYITDELDINEMHEFSLFLNFLNTKEIKKDDSIEQKRLDMVSDLPAKTVEDFEEGVDYEWRNYFDKVAKLEKLSDGSGCVLRMYTIFPADNTVVEMERLYIFKGSYIFATMNNLGDWIVRDPREIVRKNLYYAMDEVDPLIVSGTLLSYTYNIVNQIEKDLRTLSCVAVVTNSIFEQLYKAGYESLVKAFLTLDDNKSTPLNDLECHLGIISNERDTLHARFGLNKFQFDQVFSDYLKMEFEDVHRVRDEGLTLKILKNITAKSQIEERKQTGPHGVDKFVTYSSLSDIDNETFMELLSFARFLYEKAGDLNIFIRIDCARKISEMYGIKAMLSLADSMNMVNAANLFYYRDYLKMVSELDMADQFKPYFNNSYDIEDMHNEILPLYNELKEIKNRERFEQRVENWKRWEYSDENYAVVAPTTPEEVADEGVVLHHCVKTYISDVADGLTNILFIRKVSQIDKPFFTVEISNSGVLQQIHGFGNRNLSSEPDLLYFVRDWVKVKDIKNLDRMG